MFGVLREIALHRQKLQNGNGILRENKGNDNLSHQKQLMQSQHHETMEVLDKKLSNEDQRKIQREH